jgi:hypothetical protein
MPRSQRNPSSVDRARGGNLDTYIDAAAETLALPIDAAWKPAVRANLAAILRLAAAVEEFDLADEAEPAPVFEA